MKNSLRAIAAISTIVTSSTYSVAGDAQVTYERVVLIGDVAPGTSGDTFTGFFDPVVNRSGDVLYRGVWGPGLGSEGFWLYQQGQLNLVVLETDPRFREQNPDISFSSPVSFNSGFILSESGKMLIPAELRAPFGSVPGTGDSLWVVDGGELTMIAREGLEAPGTDGLVFDGIAAKFRMNGPGEVMFSTTYSEPGGSTVGAGIWRTTDGQLELVARSGDSVEGAGTAVLNFVGGAGDLQNFNDQGEIAVVGSLANRPGQDDGVASSNDSVLLLFDGDSLNVVAREGSPAPGLGGPTFWPLSGRAIRLNNSGDLIFMASLNFGNGVDGDNDEGIWSGPLGDLGLLVREGDPALNTGGFFGDITPIRNYVNARGDLFFNTDLQNANGNTISEGEILWLLSDGSLSVVAREGRDAPGTGGADFEANLGISAVNARGDAVISSSLQLGENGVTTANNIGLWAYVASLQQTVLLARKGDLFDVSRDSEPEDLRTIDSFQLTGLSGGEDGMQTCISDNGMIGLKLSFDDNTSGIFLFRLPSGLNCDFNGDGSLNFFDVAAFIAAYNAGDLSADFAAPYGTLNFFDVSEFISQFINGCP